jgi:hypothetical protein
MPSRETFAYRRGAQMRAVRAQESTVNSLDSIYSKAADDFQTFCTILDKPPAKHMLEWHHHLITGESNKYLLDIAGPNLDILSPRGSAKSTVLNLFTAWIIGSIQPLKDRYRLSMFLTTSPRLFLKAELFGS